MRVGKNGRHFRIYKLRSMVVDAEKDGAVYAATKDKRVTKFGRFLRRSRFDEIPQFINVIKGDMSVIGPTAGTSGICEGTIRRKYRFTKCVIL